MTTRQDLEREREALRGLRDFAISGYARGQSDDEDYDPRIWPWDESEVRALAASIARLDALLSLSDAYAAWLVGELTVEADRIARMSWQGAGAEDRMHREAALRAVADLVRRTP